MSQKKRLDPKKPSAARAKLAPARNGPRSRADLWISIGLTLLAWAHRLAFLASNRDRDWPFTIFYEGDSETFYRYARALLGGELYDGGIPFHPPGFAWLLAGLHTLLGAGAADAKVPYFAEKAILALVGSASIGLLYAVARPYVGRLAALGGALLSLYAFGLYVIHVAPVTEGAWGTLLQLALWIWTRRLEHPWAAPEAASGTWRTGLGLGLSLGFLALVRAEGILVAALLLGVGFLGVWTTRRSPKPASLRPWACALLGAFLVVAPWTIRNAVRLGEVNARHGAAEPLPTFVPITIYGPINLALANHAGADGTFSRALMASANATGVLDLQNPEHLRFLLHGDRMAWDWIRDNPAAFGPLVLRKWARFFGALRLGWTQWNQPGGLHGTRGAVDVFLPDGPGALWITAPLALLGLGLCLATPGGPRRWALLVLLLTGVGLAATGLFWGYARQGLLYLPLWNVLIASGLVGIGGLVRRARPLLPSAEAPLPRLALRVVGGVVLVLLLLEGWGARGDRNYQATGMNVAGESYLNRDDPVRLEVLPGD
ncbi:MAG TPA: glycosyltransferase family 39 protein [Thermoanaerobaculia bacterium]|nr:glycosyltransferase family 39 protein [Thermoanaerobaculia bacterium]